MANKNKTIKRRTHAPKIQDTSNLSDEALIRLPTVCAVTGLGRSTIWRKIKEGTFPAAVHPLGKRGGRAVISAWPFGVVRQWNRGA